MKNLIEAIEKNGATAKLKAQVANNAKAIAEYLEENGFDVEKEIDMECTHPDFDLSMAFDDTCNFYNLNFEETAYIAVVESGDSYYAKLSNEHFSGELYNWADQKLYDINETEIKRIDKLNSDGSEFSFYNYKH